MRLLKYNSFHSLGTLIKQVLKKRFNFDEVILVG